MALPDERHDDRDHETREDGDLQERPPERRLERVEVVLADREADVADRARLLAHPARDVDERLEDGGGRARAEAHEAVPRRQDLRARAVILDTLDALGRDLAVGDHGPVRRDEREARPGLPRREADAVRRGGPRLQLGLELGREALELEDEVAAAALAHGAVEDASEDEREDDAEDEAGERGKGRATEDAVHFANLYPTPTTVSMTSSPIFLRRERMWTSTVRVSMSAA